MSAIPLSQSATGTSWQQNFMTILPAITNHARIRFRHLPRERREDAIQEAIAAACDGYQKLAVNGQLHVAYPSTLADFAVRHVRQGRHVGGHQDTPKDVLSPKAQRRQPPHCRRMIGVQGRVTKTRQRGDTQTLTTGRTSHMR